jgi:L-lactate dehydrogenase complex protein LldG
MQNWCFQDSAMTTSRDKILEKLRAARHPFPSTSPRPQTYMPVTSMKRVSSEAMLARFTKELERLDGEVFVVDGDAAARDKVLQLLESSNAKRILAWHFKHIPVEKLYTVVKQAGYAVSYSNIRKADPTERQREIMRLEGAEVGLTGADAVAATTGTLVVSTAPGKERFPTILPPVHIAVVELRQFVPRLEDWLARERSGESPVIENSANVCFISGPSRTGDIEQQLVLGVHGPKRIKVIVKR